MDLFNKFRTPKTSSGPNPSPSPPSSPGRGIRVVREGIDGFESDDSKGRSASSSSLEPPPPSTSVLRRFVSIGGDASSRSKTSNVGSRTSSAATPFDRDSNTIIYEGWMYKRPSSAVGLWQMRYFVLTTTSLLYFKQEPSGHKPKGVIGVGSIMTVRESHIPSAPPFSIDIVTDQKLFVVSTDSDRSRESWIAKLRSASNCADTAPKIPEDDLSDDEEFLKISKGWLMKQPKGGGKFQRR
jgi:hypothetical protein